MENKTQYGVWRPVEEYDQLVPRPALAVFWMEPSEKDRPHLGSMITTERWFGRRLVTKFMAIQHPNGVAS